MGLLALALAVPAVAAVGVVVWVRVRYFVVTVRGPSMEPTLRSGDRVLARRAVLDRVRAGDIVILRSTALPTDGIIKRAVAVPGDPVPRAAAPALADVPEATVPAGKVVIIGDGAQSSDSRQHGYADGSQIVGVMLRRLRISE
ncbi:S26 family signal peptidase [Dactylosporangium fulvum]|uniref:Signal peptidase I n=1 Tax=Dactylosporangium fulvum TaxID=53359 RepID=A0ABY5W1E6_9ACTN|nr:signal peptidase I [Dactylosporangium fulvum]UWP83210.1 signal peptidase I [Dactylosporangium fulvum]